MEVKADKKGRINLNDLFPKKEVKKIAFYAIDFEYSNEITLKFYNKKQQEIFPKLRRIRK